MNTLSLAITDVERAFLQLEFAIKLMSYSELGHLDLQKFDTDFKLILDTADVRFKPGNFSSLQSVITASQMNVGVAFGVSAIVLDAALDTAKIQRNLKSRSSIDDLRIFVYMVRCSFAHNFAFPCWVIKGNDFARTFNLELDSEAATYDLSLLNGVPFEYSHIGGFSQWLKVKEAVLSLLNEKLTT
jgi:hypothetical protein